jgi:hypothetical protein
LGFLLYRAKNSQHQHSNSQPHSCEAREPQGWLREGAYTPMGPPPAPRPERPERITCVPRPPCVTVSLGVRFGGCPRLFHAVFRLNMYLRRRSPPAASGMVSLYPVYQPDHPRVMKMRSSLAAFLSSLYPFLSHPSSFSFCLCKSRLLSISPPWKSTLPWAITTSSFASSSPSSLPHLPFLLSQLLLLAIMDDNRDSGESEAFSMCSSPLSTALDTTVLEASSHATDGNTLSFNSEQSQ